MKKVLLLLIMSISYLTVLSQTSIVDSSLVSGVWSLSGSPYILEGRVIIQEDASLTIEPGVEIRLKSSSSTTPSWFDYSAGNVGMIRVQGEIIANGTSDNPITFTRNNTGYWGTILIEQSANPNSSFTNCIIEYAKESRYVTGINSPTSFSGGISMYQTGVIFKNNVIRNNVNGIYIKEINTAYEFSSNTIHNNGSNGIIIENSISNAINNVLYENSLMATGSVSAIRTTNSTVYLVGNLIYNNDDFGIYTTDNGNHYIVNNTIYGNYQGIRIEDGANTFIYNTIIQNNEHNFATSSIGDATVEIQNSLTNDVSLPPNITNIEGIILNSDAIFVNSNNDDFSLQNTSPCIDAGAENIDNLNIPEFDILQNIRIDNNTIDIGAIEFQHPIINFTVTTSSNPIAGGSTTGGGSYLNGDNVTVTAAPATGYDFVNWTENGNEVSTNAEYSFTVTENRTLIANFEQQSFEISATANPNSGGSISGAGSYNYGQTATLTAAPATGYDFVSWTENETQVSTDAIYEFTATADREFVANFSINTRVLYLFDSNLINAYPNPNKGQFTLCFDNEYIGEINVKFYSSIGTVIKELKINKSLDKYTYEVDLGIIPAGMYYIDIISSKEKITKTIIIL